MRRALVVPVVFVALTLSAGCSSSDSTAPPKTTAAPGETTTAPSSTAPSSTAPNTTAPPDTDGKPIDAAGCARYITLTQLFDDLEVIAGGAGSTQVAADTELVAIVDNIRDQPGAADDNVTQAIDTIATFSFQAPGSPDGPTTRARNDALAIIERAFGETCTP